MYTAQAYQNPAQLIAGYKHDSTGSPSGPYGHGSGGLFSQPGQDARVFSAMFQLKESIFNALPVVYGDPFGGFGGYQAEFETIITGVTAGNQSIVNQPTQPCAPYPNAGLTKVCTLFNPLARYGGAVRELDIVRAGMLRDIADPTYLQLVNNPSSNEIMSPTVGQGNFLLNEFSLRAFEAYTEFERWITRRVWQGDPTNSAGSNRWRDMVGLNTWINAGNKRDATTNNLCSAADSVVMPFNFSRVNGTGNDIVAYLDSVYFQLKTNAMYMGLDPVQWVIVMRPELFDEIAKVFPVRYYQESLLNIANFTNGRLTLTGSESTALRDDIRNNMYLPLRGQKVPVILDQGITELNSVTNSVQLTGGQFASDIYFIPMTVRGGIPVAYIEPFRMDNAITENIVREGRVLNTWTSDGGMFRWYTFQTGPCVSWQFETQFRLRMRTPQLAGRITSVAYQPLQHVRDAYPDSAYFANGGRTNFPQESVYTQYGGNTPVVIN